MPAGRGRQRIPRDPFDGVAGLQRDERPQHFEFNVRQRIRTGVDFRAASVVGVFPSAHELRVNPQHLLLPDPDQRTGLGSDLVLHQGIAGESEAPVQSAQIGRRFRRQAVEAGTWSGRIREQDVDFDRIFELGDDPHAVITGRLGSSSTRRRTPMPKPGSTGETRVTDDPSMTANVGSPSNPPGGGQRCPTK